MEKNSSILKKKFTNFKNVFHLKIVCAFVKEKEKEFENSSWIWPKMDLKKVHIIKKNSQIVKTKHGFGQYLWINKR